MISRTEVQSHGFCWEREILHNVYGLSEQMIGSIGYTSRYDLPAEFNTIDKANVSVKTTGQINAVCMADCLRIFDEVSQEDSPPFHLWVIHYAQDIITNCKCFMSAVLVDLTNSKTELFGSLTREQIKELDDCVKSVPQKRKPNDEEYEKMYGLRNKLQPLSNAIHLDIKCNSQQSRLQCSFNRFQQFLENNPHRILWKSIGGVPEIRGGKISHQIESGRRKFIKKPQNPTKG